MEFVRIEQIETGPEKAVSRVKRALKDAGFGTVFEMPVEPDGEDAAAGTLVVGYATELAPRAVAVAPEAALLLVTSFLLRPSGEGTQMSILDPQVLSVVPDQGDLESVIEDIRSRTLEVFDGVRRGQAGEGESGEGEGDDAQWGDGQGGGEDTMSRVEQRLYQLLLDAMENVSEKDVRKNPDQILLLSKAYAVVASLRTAEEVELHLA